MGRHYIDTATHLWNLHYEMQAKHDELTESERAEGIDRYERLKGRCAKLAHRAADMGYNVKPLAMQARQIAREAAGK